MLRKALLVSLILIVTGCGSGGGSSAPAAVTPAPIGLQGLSSTPITINSSLGGDYVRINSIDGKYSATHPTDIYVHPGDVLTLSADLFLQQQNFAPANRPVEAFAWYSSLNAQDHCSPSQDLNCLIHSNFQANNFGVSYYVPYIMGDTLQIVVSSLDSNEVDRTGRRISDRIIIHNMNWDGRPQVAPTLVTLPQQYPASTLNPNVALIGAGRWVTVEGTRYFTPYTYVVNGEEQWMPYRHGYWAFDARLGFTWISYDPWGWMTDHYGLWRHHATYGWLWLPFEDHHYEPHNVSFMGQSEYIGWFPYNDRYRDLYSRSGERFGFDDGFWLGFQVGVGFGGAEYRFRPGFAVVARSEFTNANLVYALNGRALVPNSPGTFFVQEAFAHRFVFAVPGGGTPAQGLEFVQRGGARLVPQTETLSLRSRGGATIMQPKAIYQVPAESMHVLNSLNSLKQPVAIGTMVQNHGGASVIVPPTLNGRGLVAAPLIRNAAGRVTGTLPIRTTQVAQLNRLNGLNVATEARTSVKPVAPHQVPGFDPEKAEPPARIPKIAAAPVNTKSETVKPTPKIVERSTSLKTEPQSSAERTASPEKPVEQKRERSTHPKPSANPIVPQVIDPRRQKDEIKSEPSERVVKQPTAPSVEDKFNAASPAGSRFNR